jgi:hypothetical protein
VIDEHIERRVQTSGERQTWVDSLGKVAKVSCHRESMLYICRLVEWGMVYYNHITNGYHSRIPIGGKVVC